MTKLLAPIGILGGTFDPIHQGHLQIASAVIERLPIPQVKFIPCYQPVHRAQPYASPSDRVAMIELALMDFPHFSLDCREIERKEPSFMIDTLQSLRIDYPHSPLCLILGADAYLALSNWRRWEELSDYAHFIVISRSTFLITEETDPLRLQVTESKRAITTHLSGSVLVLEIPPITISATDIRSRLHNRQDISGKVPATVAEYIQTHHLYL